MPEQSYRDRRGNDPEKGAAIQFNERHGVVMLDLGVMRNFGEAAPSPQT